MSAMSRQPRDRCCKAIAILPCKRDPGSSQPLSRARLAPPNEKVMGKSGIHFSPSRSGSRRFISGYDYGVFKRN